MNKGFLLQSIGLEVSDSLRYIKYKQIKWKRYLPCLE